ncbi:MAG: phosphate ABC transporter permease PtsA [Acidobacteria bacterium]|nr:MAG: phosphate ABC transporter permease PtsA [Acidobacteriota bacterium]
MSEATPQIQWHRRVADKLATALAVICVLLVILPLAAVFIYLVIRGVGSLNLAFFTHIPSGSPGEPGGGMANAIIGSVVILLIGSVIGVPLGVGSGIYLSEYSRGQFGKVVRFTADVLNGVPSIVIGIAVYGLLVLRQKHFSALAGGVALGIMMIPTITRSTEEMLRLVPNSIREAALGLGIPQWRSTLSITLRTAMSGVITGVMLAFARVSGETAPLLFTALGNSYWSTKLNQPIAALPLQIYVYALSPYDEWHRLAWAGALVLIVIIVATSASVRWVASRGFAGGAQ